MKLSDLRFILVIRLTKKKSKSRNYSDSHLNYNSHRQSRNIDPCLLLLSASLLHALSYLHCKSSKICISCIRNTGTKEKQRFSTVNGYYENDYTTIVKDYKRFIPLEE